MEEKNKNKYQEAAETKNLSKVLDRIIKRTSLYTKLKVPLEMEYLNLLVGEDIKEVSDKQWKKAKDWSHDMALYLVKHVIEWKKNEGPLYPNSLKHLEENSEEIIKGNPERKEKKNKNLK